MPVLPSYTVLTTLCTPEDSGDTHYIDVVSVESSYCSAAPSHNMYTTEEPFLTVVRELLSIGTRRYLILFFKIHRNIQSSKKSVESLSGEWWNCEILWQIPISKKLCITSLKSLVSVSQEDSSVKLSRRKSLTYKQQRTRLAAVLL